MKRTIKIKDLLEKTNECLILINDIEEGHGLVEIYRGDEGYKSILYQSRIANPKRTDGSIFDQLNKGKAYFGEADNMKDAIKNGLDFWFIETPEDILEQDGYDINIAAGIKTMTEMEKKYIIIS